MVELSSQLLTMVDSENPATDVGYVVKTTPVIM